MKSAAHLNTVTQARGIRIAKKLAKANRFAHVGKVDQKALRGAFYAMAKQMNDLGAFANNVWPAGAAKKAARHMSKHSQAVQCANIMRQRKEA